MQDYNDFLGKFSLNNDNYINWRREHTKMFGDIFALAFDGNTESQIVLTAALINIASRDFSSAKSKLATLEGIATSDFDIAAINYFSGLTFELIGDEEKMCEYYERLLATDSNFVYPISFHPYYRTAKFAQRDSECSKALYYYKKALSMYEGYPLTANVKSSSSKIIYDIATISLYMHNYNECERFLALSERYDPSESEQRIYVKSILCAVQNRISESYSLAEGLNGFFKQSLLPMLKAIEAGQDPHYCTPAQDRSKYSDFWKCVASDKESFEKLAVENRSEVESLISEKLTEALAFMKRRLDCRIEEKSGQITLYLKNYCVNSLINEHRALAGAKPDALSNWEIISVNWFKNY